MSEQTRRRLLLAAGSATVGTLAGCLDELSGSGDDGESGSDDTDSGNGDSELAGAVTDDGTVDYPAFVDGDITVDEDEHRIEYPDPDVEFVLEVELSGEEDVSITRELDTDARAVYVAPAYDDGFTHHVFANEAFVADEAWNAFTSEDGEEIDERSFSFDELEEGIFHDTISLSTANERAIVADADLERVERGEDDVTAVGIGESLGGENEASTPEVSFESFHESDGDGTYTVEFRHVVGDELETDSLTAIVDGDTHDDSFETDSITVGDVVTIEDVPEGETLSLVFDGETVIAEIAVGD
ncbi:hypothetical protein [Natronorubrum daqingense]|uniref:Uncharacterized protein n=1 Tax=Natronorubrum daqingense TaxID=588898 RepID=A0A1N7C651_9EURY|nr:hypothetical protein [Natronorubrum daqingense]APX96753.1 hypothetical protein BB347_09055 [Natronorubrum daqingense]SIR58924.1 hypothetical protein SAMN05421809_1533 [Natronorubrum daqingense]